MKKLVLLFVIVLLNIPKLLAVQMDTIPTNADSTRYTLQEQNTVLTDSLNSSIDWLVTKTKVNPPVFKPNAEKSLWYALIFPGLGQIYNRKYWKVPIVYGGVVGLTYAISWNGKYYRDYSRAYRDIMDADPTTKSYEKLLPYGTDPTSSYAKNLMKTKQNTYRRNRDLSIVGAVAFYALTVVDEYVDAQLADFDISPDLSMRVSPAVLETPNSNKPSVGIHLNFSVF